MPEPAKCAVCGRSTVTGPHIECVDPEITFTLRATEWSDLFSDLRHYYEVMDAVDKGGHHTISKAYFMKWDSELKAKIHEAMK